MDKHSDKDSDKLCDTPCDKDSDPSNDKPNDKPSDTFKSPSIKDPIQLQILLETEKQKCLKGIQSYYQKYGCAQIDVLRTYLVQLQDQVEDPDIQKQLDLLDHYS